MVILFVNGRNKNDKFTSLKFLLCFLMSFSATVQEVHARSDFCSDRNRSNILSYYKAGENLFIKRKFKDALTSYNYGSNYYNRIYNNVMERNGSGHLIDNSSLYKGVDLSNFPQKDYLDRALESRAQMETAWKQYKSRCKSNAKH